MELLQERLAEVLDIKLLRELFIYSDGRLIRKKTVHYNARAGSAAGVVDKSTGYIKVNFAGKVRHYFGAFARPNTIEVAP